MFLSRLNAALDKFWREHLHLAGNDLEIHFGAFV
jgi:hypothetical protein